MSDYARALLLTTDWAKRTEAILKDQIKKQGIGVTDALYNSIKSKVFEKADLLIEAQFNFLKEGRFVDMGAGRGKMESQAGNKALLTGGKANGGRKPKKWYSRPFYGRLYALNGIIGAAISEQAVKSVVASLADAK
jgi:hypothetical protein